MRHWQQIIEQFQRKKVLVIGDVGLDCYTQGIVERISPEAPVPIVSVQSNAFKLGLAANVADNLAALGAHCIMVGVVGQDASGERLTELLRAKSNIQSEILLDTAGRTILKERIVSGSQQLLRVDYDPLIAVSSRLKQAAMKSIVAVMESVDGVIIEDYAKGLLDEKLCQDIIQEAKRFKKPVFVDPNMKTKPSLYSHASCLTPNIKEAEALSGIKITDQQDAVVACTLLLDQLELEASVITLGKEGVLLMDQKLRKPYFLPTVAQEVYDVSGAGDTFISVMTLARICSASFADAAFLANAAAGLEVAKFGTATVSSQELLEFLNQREPVLSSFDTSLSAH